MHSFLLIGQSNMAGRGFLQEACHIDSSRIYTLRNGRWQQMFRPINPDRSFSGVSLAESFAEAYVKKYDADVGLICCADGGTELNQWLPGEPLFENAVNNARLAAISSRIVGVLWHQGEADCAPELYPCYQEKFETIMGALRQRLGLTETPFILGALGDFLKDCTLGAYMKNYGHINKALENIVKSNPYTALVSAEGLTSNPDHLHFNSASLYEFGKRYFTAFEALAGTPPATEVRDRSVPVRSAMEML